MWLKSENTFKEIILTKYFKYFGQKKLFLITEAELVEKNSENYKIYARC